MAMVDPLPSALLRNQEQWDVPGSGQPLAPGKGQATPRCRLLPGPARSAQSPRKGLEAPGANKGES